jgi:chemotaxis protein methyltransferase CheR
MTATAPGFDWVRSVVAGDAGIVLDDGKDYLIESRLGPLARAAGLADVSEFIARARAAPTRQVRQTLVEAMTTNETSWFRDGTTYATFEKTIVPQLRTARSAQRHLRIWSAACSSGQEPYSLAMILRESLVPEGWRTDIVATDIDEGILARARAGSYSQLEMNRGLPATRLVRHFSRRGIGWQLNEDVRSMVTFTRHNLTDSWPSLGLFDVIFLRNVLIYFTLETRREILRRVRRVCRPDAFLVLGGAETTLGVDEQWVRVADGPSTVYRPA